MQRFPGLAPKLPPGRRTAEHFKKGGVDVKYLFINTMAGVRSTGRIAADQCRALAKQGHTCVLAYGRIFGGEEETCRDIQTMYFGSHMGVRLHALRSRFLDDVGAGSKAATRRLLRWVREFDPDVIWLHNLHGYYINLELLFGYLRTCGKEIHWTLHDCWAFTGHCVHFDYVGCERWKTGCHHCPEKKTYPSSILRDNSEKNFIWKKNLFTGIPNLNLRVPSNWLKERVEQSFLGEYPVEVVYNTVNREVFRPTPGPFRSKYHLEKKYVVLGVANMWYDRKGLNDFYALSELLEEPYQIVLVGLTEAQIQKLPSKILGLTRTESVEELAQIYSAADVFVNPSYEETFGMTALEASCCCTPTIVYRGTACEEIARQFGGTVVDKGPEHLLEAIRKISRESKQ